MPISMPIVLNVIIPIFGIFRYDAKHLAATEAATTATTLEAEAMVLGKKADKAATKAEEAVSSINVKYHLNIIYI
jgi:hypothetical protein